MQDIEQTAAEHAARRAAATEDIRRRTGIDEDMIERLVRAFYVRVQDDAVLGPVFAAQITDWEPHLKRMFAFWSSVALLSGAYHGRPMQAHAPLPVDARHFDRWLALFETTAVEICPAPAAEHFIDRARFIAKSLEGGIATVNGVRMHPGERYRNPDLDD